MGDPVDLQKRGTRDLPVLVDRALAWLRESAPEISCSDLLTAPTYAAGAGAANETVLVDVTVTLESGELLDGLVIRIADPTASAFLDVDVQVQADVMTLLRRSDEAVRVPRIFAVDNSGGVLDVPAMIMERLPGRVPSDFPGYNREGFLRELPVPDRRRVWMSAMDSMIAIHRTQESRLADISGIPQSLDELLAYWSSSLDWVESRCQQEAPHLRSARRWLRAEQPDSDTGVSWGDARLGNMIFDGVECSGVLDWEMFSLGGSIADLAWWLMFDVNHSIDLGVERLEGLGRREETISYWEQGTGLSATNLRWHEVFSLFRLCVTRMSIYQHRAQLGHATPGPSDPRSVERLLSRMDKLMLPTIIS